MKNVVAKIVIVSPIIFIIYVSFRIAFFNFPVYDVKPQASKRPDGTYHYKGAIHLHTNYSHDGIGTVSEILLAASKADLNFVIITDHNNLSIKSYEGYKQGVLLIAGMEVSTPYGHFLAIDIDEPLKESERSDYFFKRVKSKGGFSIVAHPTRHSNPWTDKKNLDFEGIELINLKSYFEDSFKPPFLRGIISTLYSPINFRWSMLNILTYPRKEIEFLNDALATHPVFITCGSDAHGKPPYDKVIDFCINHIITDTPLTNDPITDKKIILSAIKNGSLYIANDFIASADGFYAYMDVNPTDNTRTLKIGVRDFPNKDALKINVYSNKKRIFSQKSNSAVVKGLPITPIRVEVTIEIPSVILGKKEILWITALIL
ncbi:MAG: CehA/McbA family metallohydrolase [Deltaproteobacteria bacterium]|nr:CehA/McbA family metallohydrolase [Deltaproteobacteria bacterium]